MASNDIRMRVLLNVEGKQVVTEVTGSVKELQGALAAAKGKADKFHIALLRFSAISAISSGLRSGIEGLSAAMQPFIDKANNAAVAQTKLRTVMEQRMNASQDDIASINKLVSAQTALGVVGGTVQRSGLQQLATFASHRATLETLLPAMNNLLTQQKGLNATNEDAVGIANLMGKALMGSATALKRVGVTLTPAQEEMIKYGDESQRAAALAKAITDNVGEMNKELAKTGAGHVKQMANEFGSLQVKVGQFFAQYQHILAGAGQMGMATSGIISLWSAVRGLCTAFKLATVASTVFSSGQKVLSGVTSACASLSRVYRVSLVEFAFAEQLAGKSALAAAVSTTAFKVAIRGLMISTAVGAVIALLTTGIEALVNRLDKTDDVSADAANGLKNTASSAAEAKDKMEDLAANGAAPLISQYESLREKWEKLTNDKARLKFISDSSEAFQNLGVKIGSVSEAEDFLVKSTDKVRDALYARAEAAAAAQVAQEEYEKALKADNTAKTEEKKARTRSLAEADGADPHTRFRVRGVKGSMSASEYSAGIRTGRFKVTSARSYQARQEAAEHRRNARNLLDYSERRSRDASSGLRRFTSGTQYHSPSKSGNSVKSGNTKNTDTRTAVEKAYEERESKIKSLQDEYVSNPGRREEIEKEIAALKEENALVDELRAKAKGEWTAPVVEAPETEQGKSGLNSATIDAWRGMKQEQLANTDLSTKSGMEAGVRIVADMDSMETLQETVKAALGKGLVLPEDAVQGLYDSIFNGDNIPTDQLQGWVDAINAQLEKAGLGKIEMKTDAKGTREIVSGGKEAKENWKDAARAVQSVGGALSGIEDPAAKVAGTIAQAIAEIALGFASALNDKKSKAGGVWGWIAAAAAGTATMISTIAAVKGATRHAAGGIVGGNTPSGDLQPVLLNSGELVLNKAQQGVLADGLREKRTDEGARQPFVTGEEIFLGLSNYLRRRGYGELVTTRG